MPKFQIRSEIISLLLSFVLTAFSYQAIGVNSVIMELIDILHNKGSITDDEYGLLKNAAIVDQEQTKATEAEFQQEVEDKISVTAKSMDTLGWASKLKVKGDVRLRYHSQDNNLGNGRGRGRIRYRMGVIAQPTHGWEVGSGFASGPSDRRSTNQTFTGTFSTKEINLDYAYAQYRINNNLKVIGGKFEHASYLYAPSDLMWDTDINPEGFSVNFTHSSEIGTTFANSGIWVLSESSTSSDDPHMIYVQLGQNFGSENLFGTITGTYYTFEDITSLGSYATNGSNSDFNFGGIYALSGEIGLNELFDNNIEASIFADWVSNSDSVTNEDIGYLVGAKVSNGPWSIKYSYADLEQNAWPDILPDADRFNGYTGIKGHEIILTYKIMHNVALDIDYYAVKSDLINIDQNLLQLDLNVKF